MDPKRRTRTAVLVALIVVLSVFASFSFNLFSLQTTGVTLPSLRPNSGTTLPPSDQLFPRIEVTPQTVQAAISSLDRAGSYYRTLTVHTFWSNGSGTTTVQTWVDDGYTYTRAILPSSQIRYSLTDGETLYYWYAGSSAYLIAPADTLSADLAQRIPTYEDVLSLAASDITDAQYTIYADHPCIYVEARDNDSDYTERYWISVENGLLIAAETVKDDKVVYSVNATSTIQTPCPDNAVFALPNGKVLHSL